MRLIDADLLLSCIMESKKKNPHEDSKIRANHAMEHDHIAHMVLAQPTVYDVDKVMERLKKESGNIAILNPTDEGFDYEYAYGIEINKAIGVVKAELRRR